VCACMCVCCSENILSDCFQGCFIVTCTLCTFISLVWLREQILHGGGPDWLDHEPLLANHRQVSPALYLHSHFTAEYSLGVNFEINVKSC